MSREDDIRKLIVSHNRRLQKLNEQRAIEGRSTDPKILIEIEDIEGELEKLKAELESTIKESSQTPPPTSRSVHEKHQPSVLPITSAAEVHSVAILSNVLPVDFIIVTALEEERDAVLNKLPGYQKLAPTDDDIRVYFLSDLSITFSNGSTGAYRIIVMPLLGMGRVQATAATVDAIRRWQPRYVLLVGIAGGIAAKDINLGDIIVSDQIVDYELQKLTPKGPQVRWEVHRADPRLVGAARNFSNDNWQNLMTVKRPGGGAPERHIGPIVSRDKVIAFGEVLEKYRGTWPAIVGVEMEAAGVATASFQAANPPGFFMVRGVSDLADEKKGSSRVKKWRLYACDVAASYAIALLKSGPIPLSLPGPILKQPHIDDVEPSHSESEKREFEKVYISLQPSWIEIYPDILPVPYDDESSHMLKGYTPFPNHRAEFETSFLFGNVGGFWSGHPTYATIVNTLTPQVILAEAGAGKTAFAYALGQIGNVDATPLFQTLPVLLTEDNPTTLKNVQNQITKSILAFVRANPSTIVQLNPAEKEFIIRFLINQLGQETVKLRLIPACEQDKNLPGIIEQFQQTSQQASKAWLGRAQEVLECLGLKRALLVIDPNRQPANRIKTWLRNLPQWGSYSIIPTLFLPLDRRQEFSQLLDRVNIRVLTWTENQMIQMAKWRFERLAIWVDIFISIEELFDGDLFFDFIKQADNNPRRLALLWYYMFEHHRQNRSTHRTFSQDDLDSAVEQLT